MRICGWVGEIFGVMTTLTSPHDLLAAIPFLIGYHPTDSLVLVSLKNESVGMAMRIDYPPAIQKDSNYEPYDRLIAYLVNEGADGALVIAYAPHDRSDGPEILDSIATALNRVEIQVRETLVVCAGRWRSLLCGDINCCPPKGRALPDIQSSRVAVEQVAHGHPMPFIDREDLADSIAALPLASEKSFIEQVTNHSVDPDSAGIHSAQREGALSVIDLASRFIAGTLGADIASDQRASARVLGALTDIQVRDFALGSHDEVTIELYFSMWRYLIRIAPEGFIAPVACLLGAVAYEKGAGAIAQQALDRALIDQPGYSLATLLRRVFSAGWPPESFSAMRKDLHPKVCAAIFEN